MRKRLGSFFLVLIVGCASARTTVYAPEAARGISSWTIDFKYEPGEIEETTSPAGGKEVKVTHEGRSARDLQLRDDIGYTLGDRYKIDIVTGASAAEGSIRIHPVHFYDGGFQSLDVELADSTGKSVLARVRVKNGNRNATFKEDDSFAEYAAQKIYSALKRLGATRPVGKLRP